MESTPKKQVAITLNFLTSTRSWCKCFSVLTRDCSKWATLWFFSSPSSSHFCSLSANLFMQIQWKWSGDWVTEWTKFTFPLNLSTDLGCPQPIGRLPPSLVPSVSSFPPALCLPHQCTCDYLPAIDSFVRPSVDIAVHWLPEPLGVHHFGNVHPPCSPHIEIFFKKSSMTCIVLTIKSSKFRLEWIADYIPLWV